MKPQDLPHYGVKNGYTRKGKTVCTAPERANPTGGTLPAVYEQFNSISQAKRFMRVGR